MLLGGKILPVEKEKYKYGLEKVNKEPCEVRFKVEVLVCAHDFKCKWTYMCMHTFMYEYIPKLHLLKEPRSKGTISWFPQKKQQRAPQGNGQFQDYDVRNSKKIKNKHTHTHTQWGMS